MDVKFRAAIYQYLRAHAFDQTAITFSQEAAITSDDVTALIKTDNLLEKKWVATTKLQTTIYALERELALLRSRLGLIESVYGLSPIACLPSLKAREDYELPNLASRAHLALIPNLNSAFLVSNQVSVELWDFGGDRPMRRFQSAEVGAPIVALTMCPDGGKLIACLEDRSVEILDTHERKWVSKFRLTGCDEVSAISTLLTAQRSAWLLAVKTRDASFHFWDIQTTQRVVKMIPSVKGARCWCVHADSLFVGTDEGRVWAWRLSHDVMTTAESHTRTIDAIAASDNNLLATGSRDSTIKVYASDSLKVLFDVKGHSDWVTMLSFNSAGSLLVSGGDDRRVCVWETASGRLLRTIEDIELRGLWLDKVGTCMLTLNVKQKLSVRDCVDPIPDGHEEFTPKQTELESILQTTSGGLSITGGGRSNTTPGGLSDTSLSVLSPSLPSASLTVTPSLSGTLSTPAVTLAVPVTDDEQETAVRKPKRATLFVRSATSVRRKQPEEAVKSSPRLGGGKTARGELRPEKLERCPSSQVESLHRKDSAQADSAPRMFSRSRTTFAPPQVKEAEDPSCLASPKTRDEEKAMQSVRLANLEALLSPRKAGSPTESVATASPTTTGSTTSGMVRSKSMSMDSPEKTKPRAPRTRDAATFARSTTVGRRAPAPKERVPSKVAQPRPVRKVTTATTTTSTQRSPTADDPKIKPRSRVAVTGSKPVA